MTLLKESDMHPYQVTCVEELMRDKVGALCLSMGLGKTVIITTVLHRLMEQGKIKKALVVGTAQLVDTTWSVSHKQWEHLQHLRFGKYKKGRSADGGLDHLDIMLVSAESLIKVLAEPFFHRFDAIVFDESTKFKSYKSKRFKALTQKIKSVDYRYTMSATFITESVQDFWSQTFILDRGDALGVYITHFRDKYMIKSKDNMGYQNNPHMVEEVYKKIRHLFVSERDALPPVLSKVIDIEIPIRDKRLASKLRSIKSQGIYKSNQEETYLYNQGSVKSSKTQQFSGGIFYLNTEDMILSKDFNEERDSKEMDIVHSLKIDMLKWIIDQEMGTPILVAYNFVGEWLLLNHFIDGIEKFNGKQEMVDRWNRNEIKVMAIHPMSASHGLNLQEGRGCVLVFYGNPWSADCYEQTIGRLRRQGQSRLVRIYRFVLAGSYDKKVLRALASKRDLMYGFVDFLLNTKRRDFVS